jgi:S-adenosylmethionine-diacylglycerol 3-amino-3-carboxypropyl transferase
MRCVSRKLFDAIHSRNLIYNQCWEDPALDHEVLNIGPSDRIVMITSAGCNALDYLLRDPTEVHCVDVNPHQNALLELKLAALTELQYEQFFEMFGKGRIANHLQIYKSRLRDRLSEPSQKIWDHRIDYFDSRGAGLYFHGTAGRFARIMQWYMNVCRGLREDLRHFQEVNDLCEQAAFYRERIAPKLWSPWIRFLLGRDVVLSLLGVPAEQSAEIKRSSKSGVSSFVVQRMERMFTTIPIGENYFWRVYMNGFYPAGCCPNYLRPEYFETLRGRVSRLRIHTATLTDFLHSTERRFSMFVLLDHMDWLSAAPDLLAQEWRAILKSALSGARIIYRSGGLNCDYIPVFAMRRLQFQSEYTVELHARDRVGTYGSFHFATVTP